MSCCIESGTGKSWSLTSVSAIVCACEAMSVNFPAKSDSKNLENIGAKVAGNEAVAVNLKVETTSRINHRPMKPLMINPSKDAVL